jgi:cytochrome P450
VLVLYASANRDETVWEQPDTFDVTRPSGHQLGFGHGTHGCAGQGLARLETQAILRQLLERIETIEPTGEPVWARNNVIRAYRTVPVRLVPTRRATTPRPATTTVPSR